MQDWLILASIVAAITAAAWLFAEVRDARRYRELKPRLDAVEAAERQLQIRQQQWLAKVDSDRQAIQQIAAQKSTGFPWLAEAYADYFYLIDLKEADRLEKKKHPACKAAESLREVAAKRRDADKLRRVLSYQINYYEKLFPWLEEFRQEDIDDLVVQIASRDEATTDDDKDDPAARWLTPSEYRTLSPRAKYQLALDRYWSKKKTPMGDRQRL